MIRFNQFGQVNRGLLSFLSCILVTAREGWLNMARAWAQIWWVHTAADSSLFLLSYFQKSKSFVRVIDGFFITDEPLDLLSQSTFHPVPSIIGVNNHECGYLLPLVSISTVLLVAPSTMRWLCLHSWAFPSMASSLLQTGACFTEITSPLSDGGQLRKRWPLKSVHPVPCRDLLQKKIPQPLFFRRGFSFIYLSI